jgi:hypothetical protein
MSKHENFGLLFFFYRIEAHLGWYLTKKKIYFYKF